MPDSLETKTVAEAASKQTLSSYNNVFNKFTQLTTSMTLLLDGFQFRYAGSLDYFLLLVGTVAAVIHGAAMPLMFIFFGDLTTGFVDFGNFSSAGFVANLTAHAKAYNLTT